MTNHAPNNAVISTGQRATFGYAYTLDGVGNRSQVELTEPLIPSFLAENTGYTYDVGNILSAADGVAYTHDANGNRTSKTNGTNVTSYTYDSLNRLTQVATTARTIQYIYNGLGQRVGKIDNGVQTNYLIDPNGILPQVLAETDASNNLISFYVYDGAGLVAKVTPVNQYYFYHYDGLGSTVAITDTTGQVVNSYCYSPEGLVGGEETIPNSFKYVGRFGVMDEGTGLLFMRARYYDPEVGRFINKDPIGYLGGINLYGYAGNNPIRFVDPTGTFEPASTAVIGGSLVEGGTAIVGAEAVAVGVVGVGSYVVATELGADKLGSWLGITLYDLLHSSKKGDPKLYEKEKQKLKRGNTCQPPKEPDPNKNPPPPIKPTEQQKIEREPLWATILRIIKGARMP